MMSLNAFIYEFAPQGGMVTSQTLYLDKYQELTLLLRAGLDGDAASYNRFLQTITPMMRRIACRKLSATDAEDALQEILISIHKARHTYDGERPIMPWLLAIAQFRINDALRKAYAGSRREMIDIHELADVLPDVTETGSSSESVNVLLENIPEREQRILTMMHMEGYTAKETGVKLGMKESAVKVAAHRAVKKIREKFGT
jgi:RNA polymerase sigma-70 factor (ECF subfamily)